MMSGRRKDPPDLHQLTTRDESFLLGAESHQQEQDRTGVVVDDEGRLGAGQPGEQGLHVGLALAPRAGLQIVLEVAVAAGDAGDALDRALRQGRAAQVGVDHHSAQIGHSTKTRTRPRLQERGGFGDKRLRVATHSDLRFATFHDRVARLLDRRAYGLDDPGPGVQLEQGSRGRVAHQRLYRGQSPERFLSRLIHRCFQSVTVPLSRSNSTN